MTRHEGGRQSTVSSYLGFWSMHPVDGLPILLAVLYLVYQFVGVSAGMSVNFLEKTVFGDI